MISASCVCLVYRLLHADYTSCVRPCHSLVSLFSSLPHPPCCVFASGVLQTDSSMQHLHLLMCWGADFEGDAC